MRKSRKNDIKQVNKVKTNKRKKEKKRENDN